MSSTPHLSVNLNKVALLRNARPLTIPSVTGLARTCIDAGAHGITVHPRPDQRHIRYRDVGELAALLAGHPAVEYNIEGNPFTPMLDLVRQFRPQQCTLVPDGADQSTSDHGWDLAVDGARVKPVIDELQALGVRVALFLDPDIEQVERAAALGPQRIELYTEPYAAAFGGPDQNAVLARYAAAAERARALGLGVNAGHDLNLDNLPALLAIDGILECSIGHALVADALSYGMAETVGKYLTALGHGRRGATSAPYAASRSHA